jgi:TrkA domain protein
VYDRADPDACQEVIQLTDDEADALAELLGAARLVEHLAGLQRIEGLAIDWLPIRPGSPYAGRTIADTQARSRTGSSIVAILRHDRAIPAPTPDAGLQGGDTLVVVGTADGIKELSRLLGS